MYRGLPPRLFWVRLSARYNINGCAEAVIVQTVDGWLVKLVIKVCHGNECLKVPTCSLVGVCKNIKCVRAILVARPTLRGLRIAHRSRTSKPAEASRRI